MSTLAQRLQLIQETISKLRDPSEITVVAISKQRSIAEIIEAYDLGLRNFGENYVQEALPKITETRKQFADILWHYVGQLQTNKMNKIIPEVNWLHSVSQISQIEKLEKMRMQGVRIPKLLIQVNIANEETKGGVDPDNLDSFLENIVEHSELEVQGLMVFPPYQDDPETNRRYFAEAATLFNNIKCRKLERIHMKELSMGVSNDYSIAIEEGATMIRLGEAIFGPR